MRKPKELMVAGGPQREREKGISYRTQAERRRMKKKKKKMKKGTCLGNV